MANCASRATAERLSETFKLSVWGHFGSAVKSFASAFSTRCFNDNDTRAKKPPKNENNNWRHAAITFAIKASASWWYMLNWSKIYRHAEQQQEQQERCARTPEQNWRLPTHKNTDRRHTTEDIAPMSARVIVLKSLICFAWKNIVYILCNR